LLSAPICRGGWLTKMMGNIAMPGVTQKQRTASARECGAFAGRWNHRPTQLGCHSLELVAGWTLRRADWHSRGIRAATGLGQEKRGVPRQHGQHAVWELLSPDLRCFWKLVYGKLAPIYQPHHGTVTPFPCSDLDVLRSGQEKGNATDLHSACFVVDKWDERRREEIAAGAADS